MKTLDKLVATLDDDDFKHTKSFFNDDEQFNLVKKKGVFPYDYFDSLEKLEQTSLPPRETFFDTLYDKECSENVRVIIFLIYLHYNYI